MARKSRATPPTIAQMQKLEAAYYAKQKVYYDAGDKLREYKQRVKDLGAGYTEVIDGEMYVIAIGPEKYGNGTEMSIVKCKKR